MRVVRLPKLRQHWYAVVFASQASGICNMQATFVRPWAWQFAKDTVSHRSHNVSLSDALHYKSRITFRNYMCSKYATRAICHGRCLRPNIEGLPWSLDDEHNIVAEWGADLSFSAGTRIKLLDRSDPSGWWKVLGLPPLSRSCWLTADS